jgi:hypothetical protein
MWFATWALVLGAIAGAGLVAVVGRSIRSEPLFVYLLYGALVISCLIAFRRAGNLAWRLGFMLGLGMVAVGIPLSLDALISRRRGGPGESPGFRGTRPAATRTDSNHSGISEMRSPVPIAG